MPIRTSSLALLLALALSVPSALAAGPNELTEAEQRSGWKLLFDGQSFDGWRNFKQEEMSKGWQIEDGTIVRAGNGAGDFMTRKKYGSFELQLEYKISKGGNSGLMFHVTEDENTPWKTGPEVQIQDNVDGHDPQKAGWLYQLYKPVKPGWAVRFEKQVGFESPEVSDASRPAGEWNHLYLRVTPSDGEVQLNGVSYFKFQKGSDDWNERVAKSKFAEMPNFGKPTEGHIALQDHGNAVSFRGIKVREIPADGKVPEPIDATLETVKTELAFPDIEWQGWKPVTDEGKQAPPLRPVHVTHAGDRTDRLFLVDQSGMIHSVDLGRDDRTGTADVARLWADLSHKVHPFTEDDEEGLLGFAFHPNFVENRRFFVYYNPRFGGETGVEPRTVRLSRFTAPKSADAPKEGDGPYDGSNEEVLMEFRQPFSNHNGGPMCFGNDGYLYIGMGDGGGRNDPLKLAQKLDTLMGGLLRIDVDHTDGDLPYAIPKDNPWVGVKGARGELYAKGIRNTWRIACDHDTGHLWIGDVGQDMWEEILVVTKPGQNFGWSTREGTKAFNDVAGEGAMTPPVWEYDHRIGKSITGGHVYRGKAIPELAGHYLYGDYVSGKLWALHYDVDKGQTIRNVALPWTGLPVLSFGEDEQGESYVTTPSRNGKSVYRIVRDSAGNDR